MMIFNKVVVDGYLLTVMRKMIYTDRLGEPAIASSFNIFV